MVNRVYEFMIRHNMIAPGSRVIAAVSGGADSMCLLEVLSTLRPRAGFELRVLHVHHGLRKSADDDLVYVSKYCRFAGIPFQAVHVDAGSYAAKNGMSVEEAARNLRYEAFEKAAREWDEEQAKICEQERAASGQNKEQMQPRILEPAVANMDSEQVRLSRLEQTDSVPCSLCRIAVAHHIEDQAETVLFNLLRGSRLTGLRGMQPVNGRIIRPMLEVSRPEIETFLVQRGISWCEDETNEDLRYTRNLIRKEVMPLLLKINAGAREHIARAAEEAAETEAFLRFETERALNGCYVKTADLRGTAEPYETADRGRIVSQIIISKLMQEPALLRRRVIYWVIAEVAGGKKDVQDAHVQAVMRLILKRGNGDLDLVGGVHVRKSYDLLYFYECNAGRGGCTATAPAEPAEECSAGRGSCAASAAMALRWPTEPGEFTYRVFPFDGDMDTVPRNLYTKWFDYDKIGTFPEFRTRREGDRIALDENGRSKTIARYMIDAKIPKELRGKIAMPAAGSEILWMPNGRISAAYKVGSGTRTILEIRWEPDTEQN